MKEYRTHLQGLDHFNLISMKNIKYFIFLLLAIPVAAIAQPSGSWPVSYGSSAPSYTPSGSGTRIYLNISTNDLYNWNPAPVSSWVKYPKGFDQISGCSAPGYTPTARQSVFAVNSCTVLQNGRGPELYQYTGSAWVCLNCYTNYTAGTGIGISSGVITNTAPDQVVSISGVGITPSGTYPNFTLTAADQSATNELQNLSLSGQSLGISSGTGVTLPVVNVAAGTGIGVSSSSGNFTVSNSSPDQTVSLTNGGGILVTGTYPSFTLTATDQSAANELNTSFSVSGSNLALTDAGGTINVPVSSIAPVQAVAAGSGISISGTTTRTVTAADVSATNELQTLSLSGSDLTLSDGGGTVTIPLTTTLDASDIVVDNSAFSVLTATDAQTAFEQTDAALSNTLNTATSFGGDISGTYDDLQLGAGAVGTSEIADNSVANTNLRQSAGLSVVGRSAATTGNVADITASAANSVLRYDGSVLGWGAVNLASSNAVTGNLPVTNLNSGSGASASTFWRGDGTWGTPAGSITGSGDVNRIPFWTGTNTLSSSSNFLWENTNRELYLGVGGNGGRLIIEQTPSSSRGIKCGSLEFGSYTTNNCWFGDNMYWAPGWTYTNTGPASLFYFINGGFQYRTSPSGTAGTSAAQTVVFQITNSGQTTFGGTLSSARLNVIGQGITGSTVTAQFHNANSNNNALIIYDNGLVGLSTASPTQTLDVNGNARFRSALYDGTNSAGSSGNILTSTGSATQWKSAASVLAGSTYVPTGTSDPLGSTGDFSYDSNYIYVKTSAGWKRTALSTF